MQYKKLKKYLFLLPVLLCILMVTFIDPESFTESIGVSNSYAVMFFIALVWWLSIFSSVPYPLFLITFALWGASPIILAMVTALGVILWDSVSYIVWKKWEKLIEGKWKDLFDVLLKFYDAKPKYLFGWFFIYGMISPFPNDLITLSAGIKKYNYFKMIIPLSLWNIIFCYALARFAEYFAVYF